MKRLYNIYFNSSSAISGTWNDSFFKINLVTYPNDDQYDFYFAVENFTIDQVLESAFIVVMPNIAIGSTYSTLNGTNQNIVLLNNGITFNEALTLKSIGNKINDIKSFVNNIVEVQILNANNGQPAVISTLVEEGTIPNWNLMFCIYGEKKDIFNK